MSAPTPVTRERVSAASYGPGKKRERRAQAVRNVPSNGSQVIDFDTPRGWHGACDCIWREGAHSCPPRVAEEAVRADGTFDPVLTSNKPQ